MSLLPQELSGPQERLRMLELPSLVGIEKKKKTINKPQAFWMYVGQKRLAAREDFNQRSWRRDCRIPTTTLHH